MWTVETEVAGDSVYESENSHEGSADCCHSYSVVSV